jgi:homoserine dehydrogenase
VAPGRRRPVVGGALLGLQTGAVTTSAATTVDAVDDDVVGIGLLGCGTVGAALVDLLAAEAPTIASRTGLRFEVARVAVRDVAAAVARVPTLDPSVFTNDPASVVASDDVDIVVEVMGGIDPARALVSAALAAHKPVVTANKALLAAYGPELHAAAAAARVDLLFEAAVAGGIPLVRPLRESLLGEPIRRVMGIVNGTTNYILTKMTDQGASYDDALAEAQRLGYAEADPSADVGGGDAAAKAAILATIAFGVDVHVDDVACEGITGITADDIAFASANGYVVKLLAIAESVPGGDRPRVAVRVHPALIDRDHPLASVRLSYNAVFVEGDAVGQLMFYGPGAGGGPTASAVLGDLIDAATNRRQGSSASLGVLSAADIVPLSELSCGFYLDVEVTDEPGVLAAVAGVFGDHGVSIRSMVQDVGDDGAGDAARLAFITHTAREADVRATIDDVGRVAAVRRIGSVIRLVAGP